MRKDMFIRMKSLKWSWANLSRHLWWAWKIRNVAAHYFPSTCTTFFQWIDGSFATQKPIPGDIDVVSFIDYDQIAKNARAVYHFTENAKRLYEVDAHFAPTVSRKHRFHQRAMTDEIYWKNIFGFSREDKNSQRHPKGIIKIKI